MKSKREFLVNLFVITISIVFSLVLAEVFLRGVMHVHPIDITPDEDLIFRLTPNHETKFERPGFGEKEFSTVIKTNSFGLRDKEYSREKPENTFRILVVGDSFTEGEQVEIENAYTEVLERELSQAFPSKNIEVLNAGVRGYFPVQELVYIQKEGLKFSPDLIIAQFFLGNDIMKASKSPIHDIDEGKLYTKKMKIHPLKKVFAFLTQKSALAKYVHTIVTDNPEILNFLKIFKLSEGATKFEGAQDSLNIPAHLTPYHKESSESIIWEHNKVVFENFKKIEEENDIPIVFMLVPTKEEIDPQKKSEELELYNLSDLDLDYNQPFEKINEMFNELSIKSVDVKSFLLKLNKKNSFYFEVDGHMNENGQYVVGKVLARDIKRTYSNQIMAS